MKNKILIVAILLTNLTFSAQISEKVSKKRKRDENITSQVPQNKKQKIKTQELLPDNQEILKKVLCDKIGKTTIMEFGIVLGMVKTEKLLLEILEEVAKNNAHGYLHPIFKYNFIFDNDKNEILESLFSAAQYAVSHNNLEMISIILAQINADKKLVFINKLSTYAALLGNIELAIILNNKAKKLI